MTTKGDDTGGTVEPVEPESTVAGAGMTLSEWLVADAESETVRELLDRTTPQSGRHEHDWSEWSHPDALDPTREIRHCKCGAAENRHPQSGRADA